MTLKILKHYLNSGQEIYLEYPLDVLKHLAKCCPEQQVAEVWEIAIGLQSHEDVVIREKAEDLVEELIKNKKISSAGKWQVKGKKGAENY